MGMSDFHEIEFLSKLARPEVGCDYAHRWVAYGTIGKQGRHCQAKLEILSGLQENGTFIYPAHEELITAGLYKLKTSKLQHRYSWRKEPKNSQHVKYRTVFRPHSVWISDTNWNSGGHFTSPGAYNVSNALLAIEIARNIRRSTFRYRVSLSELRIDEEPYAMGERAKRSSHPKWCIQR